MLFVFSDDLVCEFRLVPGVICDVLQSDEDSTNEPRPERKRSRDLLIWGGREVGGDCEELFRLKRLIEMVAKLQVRL